jgi:hypothetical protein
VAGQETRWVSSFWQSYAYHSLVLITSGMISNPTLEFVAAPALAPAEVAVDEKLMAEYAAELQRVCLICNPSSPMPGFLLIYFFRQRPFPFPKMMRIFRLISNIDQPFTFLLCAITLSELSQGFPRLQYQHFFAPRFIITFPPYRVTSRGNVTSCLCCTKYYFVFEARLDARMMNAVDHWFRNAMK